MIFFEDPHPELTRLGQKWLLQPRISRASQLHKAHACNGFDLAQRLDCGGGCSSIISCDISWNIWAWGGDLSHLEIDMVLIAYHLRADLDELLKAYQRPS